MNIPDNRTRVESRSSPSTSRYRDRNHSLSPNDRSLPRKREHRHHHHHHHHHRRHGDHRSSSRSHTAGHSSESRHHRSHSHRHERSRYSDDDFSDSDLEGGQKDKDEQLIEERRKRLRLIQEKYKSSPVISDQSITPSSSSSSSSSPSPPSVVSSSQQNQEIKPPASQISEDSTQTTEAQSSSIPPSTTTTAPIEEFDMFSTTSTDVTSIESLASNSELADSFDDKDGYYLFHMGEILGGRYKIYQDQGRGMFSSVVKAQEEDPHNHTNVAIKIIRNKETMLKTGLKELSFCEKIRDNDPNNHSHCVRVLGHFYHRSHLCIVFEAMAFNLREILKKFGKNVGLNITAVKLYARQLVRALKHLTKLQIIHGDFKPDNLLVNDRKNIIKIADFGSACEVTDMQITPYLVSRWYRAPEVILGLPYDTAIDMWALGCTLYELYTGFVLFTGNTNNEMLKQFQELRGRFPNRMIKKGHFGSLHFDGFFNFKLHDFDSITGKPVIKTITFTNPTRSLHSLLFRQPMESDEAKLVQQLENFLERCLTLDPDRRMSPDEALAHPFLTSPQTV